jgi:septum formation protein
MQLILGSSSASRRQILSEMGYQLTLLVGDFSPCFQMLDRSSYCFVHFPSLFLVFQSADIDEKAIRKEKPEELVVTLAHAKVISLYFCSRTGFHCQFCGCFSVLKRGMYFFL